LFDDYGNKVEPSLIINWVQDQTRKMDLKHGVLVIGNPAELNMELIREAMMHRSEGLHIGVVSDVELPERGVKISRLGDGGIAAQVNKLCEEELTMTITNPYEGIPKVKIAPKFPPEDPKPHPTSWRQSNRHYKKRK
jgi:hypothetical protein